MSVKEGLEMSDLAWIKNEIEIANNFLDETLTLLDEVEHLDRKLEEATSGKEALEKEIVEKLRCLRDIKEEYMEEEFMGSIEALDSEEETRELSDRVCNCITKMNQFIRKYHIAYMS